MSLAPMIKEPVTIAHLAMFLLAALGCTQQPLQQHSNNNNIIDGLVGGILSRQRDDGALLPKFDNINMREDDDDPMSGIAFIPGQAMVALMEAYATTADHQHPTVAITSIVQEETKQRILRAMDKAFDFYSSIYYDDKMDANFNIWQIQAISRLLLQFEQSSAEDLIPSIDTTKLTAFILDMCRDIATTKSWRYDLGRGSSLYSNVNTIEIACGLDAIADGLIVAHCIAKDEETAALLVNHMKNAIYFLEWSLDRASTGVDFYGRGGLGFSGVQVLEQRLDVTGPAVSGLTKIHRMGIVKA